MNYYFLSLGCSKNTADSEQIANSLHKAGWSKTDNLESAQVAFVNTCGFINDAKLESLERILQLIAQKPPHCKTVVFGCLVKRYRQQISKEIPEIDFFFDFIDAKCLEKITNQPVKPNNCSINFFTPQHIGFLKISEGCSNNCSYCSIPSIRGPHKSFNSNELLKQAQAMKNVKELSIIAQDTTRFGDENNETLANLLKNISQINEIEWIRLHYLHPEKVNFKFIDTIFSIPKVLPYFDIPFQHTSDRILNLMNRRYTSKKIIDIIKYIRKTFPNGCIRTTFIIGFPSETDNDFNNLIDFIERYPIDRVGAFAYSTEEGTKAKKIAGKINKSLKTQRLDELMTLQQMIAIERNSQLTGCEVDIMIDSVNYARVLGRTVWDAWEVDNTTTLKIPLKKYKPGQIIKAKIIGTDAYDFIAEPIK